MDLEVAKYFAAALSIAVTGIASAFGEGMVAAKAMEAMGRNPAVGKDMFTRLIVAMGLIESIAIYGFVTTLIILFVE